MISENDYDDSTQSSSSTVELPQSKTELTRPSLYKVLLHNDDFTPMDFVVGILESFFGKNENQATKIMLDVHRKGVGVCGVFTKEVAETKTSLVTEKAKQHHFPLKCTHEADHS